MGLSGWDNIDTLTGVTVTYNGVPMTKLGGQQDSNEAILWGLVSPALGAHTIAVANIPVSFAELGGGSVSFTGVNQTTPTGTLVSNGTASVNITLVSGDMSVDILYGGSATETTVGAGQIKRVNANSTGGLKWHMMSTEAGSGTVTMDWTGPIGDNAIAAIPIKTN